MYLKGYLSVWRKLCRQRPEIGSCQIQHLLGYRKIYMYLFFIKQHDFVFYAWFQLTETGESGVDGALVLRHANRANNQERVNVIHLLHSTVERNVMARKRKVKFVIRKFPAQVRLVLQPLCHLSSFQDLHFLKSSVQDKIPCAKIVK